MAKFKTGDTVRVKNDIFTSYGCKGTVIGFNGDFITVRMKRLFKKLDESEFVNRQYYPSDLKMVS